MDGLEINVRLRIGTTGDKHKAFGYGTCLLLRGVERTGSLYSAAKELGMAYSKAWTGLKNTELELGAALIERRGARGSVLTADGARFLEAYDEASAAALEAAQAVISRRLA